MPAQVADWSQVKATAIHTGNLKEAADLHGSEYGAVRVRAHRENWPVGRRVHVQLKQAMEAANNQIIKASNGSVTAVTSASEAAETLRADLSKQTKMDGLRYAARTMKHAAELAETAPEVALAQAGDVKAVLQGAAISGDWSAGKDDHSLHLSFFQLSAEREEAAVERPVIDVEQA